MPDFISRVQENEKNRILVYYGDYKIDELYQMNEFLSNSDLSFYKLQQMFLMGSKQIIKDRYVVLTDVYFLLFDPIIDNMNIGKLLFWGDIRQLSTAKVSNEFLHQLTIEWKSQDKAVISFVLSFKDVAIKEFLGTATRKIVRIKDNFQIFHDELMKSSMEDSLNYERLVLLIKFKEDLLKKQKSPNIVKELMNLYQKIIEVLSERSDDAYEHYLNKMKNMLQNEEIQKLLEEPGKKEFELSKTYYSSTYK